MSGPTILGIPKRQLLSCIGSALLQTKNANKLKLDEMAETMGRSDEAIAQYIAGEAEMGVVTWLRACEEYPELPDLVAETAAERAAKARQRALDLELTRQKEKAA